MISYLIAQLWIAENFYYEEHAICKTEEEILQRPMDKNCWSVRVSIDEAKRLTQ